MLTVLIKHKDTGRDVLFEAHSVEFENSENPGAGLLINHDLEGQATHLGPTHGPGCGGTDCRDVFVMNSAGQTVARYTL